MGTAGNAPLAFWVWFHAADSLASRLWLLLRRGRAPPGSLRALRRPVPPLLAMLATLLVLLPTEASLPRRGRCPVGVCARMGSCLARCEDRRRPEEEEEARIGAGDAGGAPKTLLEPRVGAGGPFSSANQRRSCISSSKHQQQAPRDGRSFSLNTTLPARYMAQAYCARFSAVAWCHLLPALLPSGRQPVQPRRRHHGAPDAPRIVGTRRRVLPARWPNHVGQE